MAKLNKQIVVRVNQSTYERLQDNADARDVSLSDYIRHIVKPSMYRHNRRVRAPESPRCNAI